MTTADINILHGQEFFLIDSTLENIKKKRPNASTQQFSEQFDINDLIQATQSTGLFASETNIVIKNPWFLSKKLSDSELETVINTFKHLSNPDISIIICQYGALDQRKKIATQLKKVANMQKFEPFKDWEQDKFRQWINQHLKSLGKDIKADALQLLTELLPNSLRAAASECSTLCTFVGDKSNIEVDDVKAIATDHQLSIYQFLESLKKRQLPSLFKAVKNLQEMGEEPIRFLALLSSTFRQYNELLYARESGISIDLLAKKTAKNPYFLKMLLKDIQGTYKLKDAKRLSKLCADLDYQIKSGKVKGDYVFQSIAGSICNT